MRSVTLDTIDITLWVCLYFLLYVIFDLLSSCLIVSRALHLAVFSRHCRCDCSHEVKRRLLLGREVMTNLDSIFKSRVIILPIKFRLVKALVFPVVTYECESWTVKKAECWRIDTLNCGVGEDSWESLGLQEDPTSPFWRRSALGVLWKEWC